MVVVLPTPPFWLHIEMIRALPWMPIGRGSGRVGPRAAGRAEDDLGSSDVGPRSARPAPPRCLVVTDRGRERLLRARRAPPRDGRTGSARTAGSRPPAAPGAASAAASRWRWSPELHEPKLVHVELSLVRPFGTSSNRHRRPAADVDAGAPSICRHSRVARIPDRRPQPQGARVRGRVDLTEAVDGRPACRPAWSSPTRGRAAPGRPARPRRRRGGGWRTSAAACAARPRR